jgi:hypothetical protein
MSKGPRSRYTPFRVNTPTPIAGKTTDDYQIYASYRRGLGTTFFGTLKVQRTTDKRLLFPFDGCPVIGPFSESKSATQAAIELGEQIIESDLSTPEL